MIKDIDKFEDLPPEQAKFVLAETKLKLMNLMSHLEFLESRLANREKSSRATTFVLQPNNDSISNSNPAQQ
jgi:hypothetical protein